MNLFIRRFFMRWQKTPSLSREVSKSSNARKSQKVTATFVGQDSILMDHRLPSVGEQAMVRAQPSGGLLTFRAGTVLNPLAEHGKSKPSPLHSGYGISMN